MDKNDQIFKTKDGKWQAVVDEIVGRHEKRPAGAGRNRLGRGVGDDLRGAETRRHQNMPSSTPSPEHAEREGELIAQAGRKGAVMIATNMAGRGVDIKLGGDAEHLAISDLKKAAASPTATEGYEEALTQRTERAEAAVPGRGRRSPRTRGALHLRHRAPRVAPDRQPAARSRRPPGRSRRVALLPLRRRRRDPPLRRRSHLQNPRSNSGRSTTTAAKCRSRPRCSRKRSRTRRRRSRNRTS